MPYPVNCFLNGGVLTTLTAYILRESSDVCACAGADIWAAAIMAIPKTMPKHVVERIDGLINFATYVRAILMMLVPGTTRSLARGLHFGPCGGSGNEHLTYERISARRSEPGVCGS